MLPVGYSCFLLPCVLFPLPAPVCVEQSLLLLPWGNSPPSPAPCGLFLPPASRWLFPISEGSMVHILLVSPHTTGPWPPVRHY